MSFNAGLPPGELIQAEPWHWTPCPVAAMIPHMMRGLLGDSTYKPQFSGHETFPLRHLWLRKAYDAVRKAGPNARRGLFTDPDSIIRFGVGKNMVAAIRHWALACEVIAEGRDGYITTPLGDFLFGPLGVDPYMENPTSAWLVQWMIAGRARRTTTWYWAFNYFPSQVFEREMLAAPLLDYCSSRGSARVSPATIKRDVECFIRSYVPHAAGELAEELTEPVLGELGLLHQVGSRAFEFRRGPKPTLSDGIFLFALLDFWFRTAPQNASLAYETIAYEPGSPGRVFKLHEDSVAERLTRIEEATKGVLVWSDTAGLRQIIKRSQDLDPMTLLSIDYVGERAKVRRAAR